MKDLVYDTETTDLITNTGKPLKSQPSIIEFYGVTVDRDTMELGEEWGRLIKPPMKTSAETLRITGISWDMLINEKPFSYYANQIKERIESHDRVVAHNAGFDVDMVNYEFERLGIKVRWPEVVCTIEATEYLKGYRLNLGALHQYCFGEDFTGHHRAKEDTQATARCYADLLRRGIL